MSNKRTKKDTAAEGSGSKAAEEYVRSANGREYSSADPLGSYTGVMIEGFPGGPPEASWPDAPYELPTRRFPLARLNNDGRGLVLPPWDAGPVQDADDL